MRETKGHAHIRKNVYSEGMVKGAGGIVTRHVGTIVLACLDCGETVTGKYGQKNAMEDKDEKILRVELNSLECRSSS